MGKFNTMQTFTSVKISRFTLKSKRNETGGICMSFLYTGKTFRFVSVHLAAIFFVYTHYYTYRNIDFINVCFFPKQTQTCIKMLYIF